MSSILQKIFGTVNPQAVASPANAAAAQPGNPPAPATDPVQQQQQQQQPNAAPAAPTSPLDGYKDLWQPVANANNDANAPLFNIDAAKITEAASKANFTAGISPELAQAALKGDANALSQIINSSSQQAFAQATIASTKLIEQALEKHGQRQAEQLPNMVKRQMVSDSLATNPLYQHEATRPLLAALEQQLAAKHPNATAAQITEHAQKFIAEFANVARGPQNTQDPTALPASKGGNDFSEFLLQ